MGSKTPLEHRRGSDESSADAAISASNPPKPAAASGLVQGVLEGQEDSGDEDEDQNVGSDVKAVAKKRKRKNRKKKKKTSSGLQTAPPTVELSTIFKDQLYPEGEIVEYDTGSHNTQRTTAQELRHQAALENMDDDFLKDYRKAAEVHRQVRQYAQTIIRPGVSMSRIAQEIESGVRALVGHQGIETGDPLKAGMGFPTGLCLNNIGAHWTPNPGSKEIILDKDDVLSVDFGVHVNGRIVDSAFTVAFNPVYDTLLEAVREATNVGIKEAGIDARIAPISAAMQDVMESYEVELNGKTIPVKAVRTIAGHNILRYKIHGDKQVPFVRHRSTQRMEEGDVFAIETFGSTGSGWFQDGNEVYGYSRNDRVSGAGLRQASARALLKSIDENFGTIPFARSYLERVGVQNYLHPMKTLVSSGIVESYPPLVDIPGSYVAQFEHTVLLRPNCKEVITRGDDY